MERPTFSSHRPGAQQPTAAGTADDREPHDAWHARVHAYMLTRRGWLMSRRKNPYSNRHGCHIVLWPVIGGWRFNIRHKASGVTWESNTTFATVDEAKLASLDKLSERLPELLRRLAAERSNDE